MSKSEPAADSAKGELTGYEILVGVAGGISAYKTCGVVSALVQRGAGVTCVMTKGARRFVRPLTFQALSGRKVLTSLWAAQYAYDPQHIRLSERLDLVVIAPATANLIARMAQGMADDLLTTLLTSVTCPVLLAPAMNERMWANAFVAENVRRLREHGFQMVGPGEGWMACRTVGVGRMAEPDEIVAAAASLCRSKPPLANPKG